MANTISGFTSFATFILNAIIKTNLFIINAEDLYFFQNYVHVKQIMVHIFGVKTIAKVKILENFVITINYLELIIHISF